jgi:hypothetical protein
VAAAAEVAAATEVAAAAAAAAAAVLRSYLASTSATLAFARLKSIFEKSPTLEEAVVGSVRW